MNMQALFEGYIDTINDYKRVGDHTRRVVALCERFSDMFPDAVDRELLISSAWLHDIAKYYDNHNDPQVVLKVLKKHKLYIEQDSMDAVVHIIAVHKGAFNPDCNAMESAVLRICDKLDKFEKGQSDAEKKCKKSMKRIEESRTLNDSQLEKLKLFYQQELQARQ